MNEPHGYKIYMVDDEPYFPGGKFDQDLHVVSDMVHMACVVSGISLALSIIAFIVSIIAILP